MYLIPEKELYTIVQQYYSGKFADIISLDLETEFDFSNILYNIEAQFYKIRSFIALNDLNNASTLLKNLENLILKNTEINSIDNKTSDLLINDIKILNSFIDFKKLNTIDNDLLNLIDDKIPSLALIYKKIIQSNVEISPESPDLDLESFIYIIFSNSNNYIKESDYKKLIDLKHLFSDSLILDFAIAWAGLSKPTNTSNIDDSLNAIKSSYYFFDELTTSSNTDSSKNFISLLASHLKLGNIPEALECIEKLNSLNDLSSSWNYSLLINKIALASITSNKIERENLIKKIYNDYPNSNFVNDLNEKSQLFDSIVASYN
jgi:hypothetical protein